MSTPSADRPRGLIVIVPGSGVGPERWNNLLERLKKEPTLAGYRQYICPHGAKVLSRVSPLGLARNIRARIDEQWKGYGPFEDIILVGHSFGGLLIRQVFVNATGGDHIQPEESEWWPRVSRIILFAAMNRGWDPASTVRKRFASWIVRVMPYLDQSVAAHLIRGSDFISNLRIQWIRLFHRLDKRPVVVQLVGTKDALVTSEDSVDVENFDNAYYMTVADAAHDDLYRPETAIDPDARYALLREPFVSLVPRQSQNRSFPSKEQFVFVVHGIRATNRTWAEDTRKLIERRWLNVEAIAPEYGRISAWQFAVPTIRRKYTRWLKDQYTECLAKNPNAQFSYIGHSNGTYIFGETLKRIPAIRFDRAVLVGTVLPPEFDWPTLFQRGQLRELRVDGGATDWPVGWLCAALHGIGSRDVGTAGIEGFRCATPRREFFSYRGGHGAPLRKENLEALAEFAISGYVREPAALISPPVWFSLVSRAAAKFTLPAVALGLAAYVLALTLSSHGWLIAVAGFGLAILIYVILEIL